MLRKIPDSAVAFVRDGVLAASVLGIAERAERLEHYARKRAAEAVRQANETVESLQEEAYQAGYQEGLQLAFSTFVPWLAELLADETQLKSWMQRELELYIRNVLSDAGIEAALIDECCRSAADLPEHSAWTLYLPEDRVELAQHLTATTPSDVLNICFGQAPYPVLERGEHVIELDAQRQVSRQLIDWLAGTDVTERIRQRASDYAAEAVRALKVDAERMKFHQMQEDANT